MRLASVVHSLAAVPAQEVLECPLCELGYLPLSVPKVRMLSARRQEYVLTCLVAQFWPTSHP